MAVWYSGRIEFHHFRGEATWSLVALILFESTKAYQTF